MSSRSWSLLAVALGASLAVVGASALATAATRSSVTEPTSLPPVCEAPAPGQAPDLPDLTTLGGLPGDLPADAGALADRLRRDPAAAGAAGALVGPGTPDQLAERLRALAGEGGGSGGSGTPGGSGGGRGGTGSSGTGTGGSGTGSTGTGTGAAGTGSGTGGTGGSGTGGTSGAGGTSGGGSGSTGSTGTGGSTGTSTGTTGAGGTGTGTTGSGGTTGAAPQTGSDAGSEVLTVPSTPPSPPPPPPQAAPEPERETDRPTLLLVLLAAIAVAVLVALAAALVRSRTRSDDGAAARPTMEVAERQLALAEQRQDHEAALRWVFVTGLLRLDAAGVLPWDPSRTSADVSRLLRRARFDELRSVFDEVVYGRRPATARDVDAQRTGWAELLAPDAG